MDRIDELRKKLISAAKRGVQERYEGREVHIIKAVNLLEDLDSVANLLTEQVREWYSAHFPELNELVPEHKEYLRLCHYIGARNSFTTQKVLEQLANKEDSALADKIVSAAGTSMGSEAGAQDLDEMRSIALNCLNMLEEREALSKYLEASMEKELPNFTAVAGPTIGAKILARIGSKRKLAFLPASTLQIVGAEKALFLHFRTGVKGPKYGYLYQHPLVKAASHGNKGRMARTIAAKLSIAAKMDYFGSSGNAEEMKRQLEARAKELSVRKHKEKPAEVKPAVPARPYPAPQQKPQTPFPHSQERRRFAHSNMERRPHHSGFRGGGHPRHDVARGREHDWKGGRQKRDYHSTERKVFQQTPTERLHPSHHDNHRGQQSRHGPHHGKFNKKPRRERGDIARKRF